MRRGGLAGPPNSLVARALGTVIAGSTTSLLRPAAIPSSRSFRLHWVEVEFCVVNTTPSVTTNPFVWFPAMVELATYSPTGQRVARSSPFLVGATPRTVRLTHPANEDWFPYDITTPIIAIDGICVDKRLSSHTIAFFCARALYSLSSPDASEACPALLEVATTSEEAPSVFELV